MAGAPKGHSGGGRPPNTPEIEIDEGRVYSLAAVGCTVLEIAKIIGCSTDTLHRRFQSTIDAAKSLTNSKIRSVLLEEALQNRNTVILKHIADRYLGAVDSPLVELKLAEAAPRIVVEYVDPTKPKAQESINADFHEVEGENEE